MSKDGYYGDFGSFAEEQEAYEKWLDQQESEVVQCECGNPMYETQEKCDDCSKKARE